MQNHLLPIVNVEVAGRMERPRHRYDLEMTSKEWMSRVRDLDHGRLFWDWVLEWGIKLIGRLMRLDTGS
jgi:hypothetical protein